MSNTNNDAMDRQGLARRAFLWRSLAATGTLTAAMGRPRAEGAPPAEQQAVTPTGSPAGNGAGYRLTAHVRQYYETASL
jgi:hypothetical protein